jgi:hypothetical protein
MQKAVGRFGNGDSGRLSGDVRSRRKDRTTGESQDAGACDERSADHFGELSTTQRASASAAVQSMT